MQTTTNRSLLGADGSVSEDGRRFLEALSKAFVAAGSTQSPTINVAAEDARESVRTTFREAYGYDPQETVKNFDHPRFSIREVYRDIRSRALRESIANEEFFSLTTYGAIGAALDKYQMAEVAYRDVALMTTSNSRAENYALAMGSDIPDAVEDGEEAGTSRMGGFNVRIENVRFAEWLEISRQAIDDDQTNQLTRESGKFGNRMAHTEEKRSWKNYFAAYVAANLFDPVTNPAGVPKTNLAGYAIGQGGAVTTPGQVNQARLEDGWTAATFIADPLGNILAFKWNAWAGCSTDELLVSKLLESMYSPTVPGGAGSVGYFMTKNVLSGKFTVHTSAFIQTSQGVRDGLVGGTAPWSLMIKQSESMVFQRRAAITTVQEPWNTGKSLALNQLRTLVSERFEVKVVDPRFSYAGN